MKKTILRKSLFLLALAAASSACAVEITKDWKIIYPDGKTGVDSHVENGLYQVSHEIALDIEEATGLKLPVVVLSKVTEGTRGIWLGAKAAKDAGFSFDDWRFQENAYAVTNGNVYCFGNDRTGFKKAPYWENYKAFIPSARATMRFMRDVVGSRYLMPGRTGTYVPKRDKIEVADGTFRYEKPQFFYGNSRGDLSYNFANNCYPQGAVQDYGGHSFQCAVPQTLWDEHPDYFGADKKGKRIKPVHNWAVCISNPGAADLVYREAEKHLVEDGCDVCQVGHPDGDPRCYCEKCLSLYGTGDDWGEKFWIFYRKMAERMEKEHPGKILLFMSYGVNSKPPKTFDAFPSNTMVQICHCTEEIFKMWQKIKVPQGFSTYIYLWGNYHPLGFTPRHSFAGLSEFANRLHRYNVRGIYRCGYGDLHGLEGPAYYYFNRLLENPQAGIAETLKEFCDCAFGPEAGEPMYRFYEALDVRLRFNDRLGMSHWEAEAPDVSKWAKADDSHHLDKFAYIYTPDVISTLDGCLAHAKRCKLTEREKTRLKRVEVEWVYARNMGRIALLYNGYRAAPSYERIEPLLKEIQWRRRYLDRVYAPQPKDAKKPDWLWISLFGGAPRNYLDNNSRLSPIHEPLDWDIETMFKDRMAPGAPSEVARWKKHNKEKGLKPLVGWYTGKLDKGDVFEVRPDGTGFVMSPGNIENGMRVFSSSKERKVKPNTRYRISWFARLEDVRIKPRWFERGFHAIVGYGPEYHDFLFEPAGGIGLIGSSDWRYMSTTVKTKDKPDFSLPISFRLLTGIGRVEVEDVTIEELGE